MVRRTGRTAQQEYLLLHHETDRCDEPRFAEALRAVKEQAGTDRGEVYAVDLSKDPGVFACELVGGSDPAQEWVTVADLPETVPSRVAEQILQVDATPPVVIGLRPMTRADFPDVVRWQAQPHVARWWSHEATDVIGAERHYGPALDGTDPTRMWVLELNGRSVGFFQDYLIGDHPEYALLTARPEAVGFDYAIGEPAWVGRGVGTRALWTFLRDVVRPHYRDAPTFFAAPDHRNAASLRVLDKLGFERGLWFDEPQPDGRVDTVVSCTLDVRRMFG